MSVPYSHSVRPDTGVSNVRLGLALVIAADAMFFGALFSSYAFLRTAAQGWPHGPTTLNMPMTLVLSGMLLLSAALVMLAAMRANLGYAAAARTALGAGAVSGLLFASGLAATQTLVPHAPAASHNFFALYYLISGMVAGQTAVAAGCAVVYAYVAGTGVDAEPRRFVERTACLAAFHVFLAVVWLITLALFFIF